MVFHTLNGRILPSLDTLSFEHFRESALSFFGDESVFCDKKIKVINNISKIGKANDQVNQMRHMA